MRLRLRKDPSVNDSDIPLLHAAQEFTATRGMFQDSNEKIVKSAVLAKYDGSKAIGPSGGPVRYAFALCGVKTISESGEEKFVVLHMMNTGAMWHPRMFPLQNSVSGGINVLWSNKKPNSQQVAEQTGFPELGTEWKIDNEELLQTNWEEFVIGKPPANFVE